MREIEAKILEIDKGDILKRLKGIGAKKKTEQLMTMEYFDSKSNQMRKHRNSVRIRNEGNKNVMTCKSFMESKKVKIREETNLEVSDLAVARKILEHMGFSVTLIVKKKKTIYEKGRTKFEINEYLGKHRNVPVFLEIESPSQKELFGYVKKLGFSERDAKPWSTFDVISHYSKARH